MQHLWLTLVVCIACGLSACSTGRMIESAYEPQSGRTEVREYSKFYDAGSWLVEGKLGLQLAIAHEKTFVPVLYDIQRGLAAIGVPGALGQSDLNATGIITLYIVNLELQNRSVRILRVSNGTQSWSPDGARDIIAGARTQTRSDMGSVPILNYGKEITLSVEYEIDGVTDVKSFVLKRRTDRELEAYFSRGGRPPYPWYQAPYYPFHPPLFRPKQ